MSGPAAARLQGFDGFSRAPLELSITKHKNLEAVPFVVHRVDLHLLTEIQHVGEIPVTSARRTFIDLGAVRHRRTLTYLNEAIRKKQTTAEQSILYLEQQWMIGRRGVGVGRKILRELTGTEHLTQSEVEQRLAGAIHRSDIPMPIPQFPLLLSEKKIRFDFAYPEQLLAIEVDGYAWHGDRSGFNRDHKRDVEARKLGWTVLRFTWGQVMFELGWVLDSIRAVLI